MTLRVVFIGCVEMSHMLLAHLIDLPQVDIVGVVTRRRSPVNSDFRDLAELAAKTNARWLYADDDGEQALIGFLRDCRADVVFCFGWSKLLPREAIEIAPLGAIGFHPAALPANRGRHPLIWALTLGLSETASKFFLMEEGADSGPILSQESVAIEQSDYAADLYAKISEAACRQLAKLASELADGRVVLRTQDPAQASSWRKRGAADGRIDWRMPAYGIYNLVRGLSHPYVGAHCETGHGDVKVWRAEIGPTAPCNIEPGKVVGVDRSEIIVKCGDGTVRVIQHEFPELPRRGCYL